LVETEESAGFAALVPMRIEESAGFAALTWILIVAIERSRPEVE
jgi:hypothetical protein